MGWRAWTDEEIGLLESGEYTVAELAQMLNRTQYAVQCKLQQRRLVQVRTKRDKKYANGICNLTCPGYCPYSDCKLSGAQILMEQYKQKKVNQ